MSCPIAERGSDGELLGDGGQRLPDLPDLASRAVSVSVTKNNPSREEDPGQDKLSEHRLRGWRAVSAAALQGQGLH